MTCRGFIMTILCLAVPCVPSRADVKLPAIIGDHMVLQQKSEVPLWGWAEPGEEVTVSPGWRDRAISTQADGNGKWSVGIPTPGPGGPHVIFVQGRNEIIVENVMIGEVWICSGQSNMEMPVDNVRPGYTGVVNYEKEIASADRPMIRLFDVENRYAGAPEADCVGTWKVCSPDAVRGFSAVAYFFGREINESLDIPVGLIGTNWGGTPIEAWTSADSISKVTYFASALEDLLTGESELEERYQEKLKEWHEGLDAADGGMAGRWMSVDLDDSNWQVMPLPQHWEEAELSDFDGIAWFRKTVEIPKEWSGRALLLELGPIDDMDVTWFNGEKVGGMEELNYWQTPRQYTVPAELVQPGANVIAVRVHDTGGVGGIYGKPEQLRISPAGEEKAVSLVGDWRFKKGIAESELQAVPRPRRIHPGYPTVLYNGMISPIKSFGIRGVIWYQGESNCSRAYQYRELFPAMIADWRKQWGRGSFPFFYVQIAPFKYNTELVAAELREAQLMTLAVENTGMAVTTDVANLYDIHPRNKQEVGRRLALWALARTYGKDLVYSGPLFRSMTVEGRRIRLHFDHVGGGLVARGGELTHFTLAGDDQRFVPARAEIEGDSIVVSSEQVSKPVAVRFGWSNTAEPNLFNREGLPASPFRTDDWPGVTSDHR